MAQVDRGLVLRETQLKEAVDLLTKQHGAQSETVGVLNSRLKEVQDEMSEDSSKNTDDDSIGNAKINRLPKVKDGTLMFVLIGGILIFAFGGMSTMFVLMIALGFGK